MLKNIQNFSIIFLFLFGNIKLTVNYVDCLFITSTFIEQQNRQHPTEQQENVEDRKQFNKHDDYIVAIPEKDKTQNVNFPEVMVYHDNNFHHNDDIHSSATDEYDDEKHEHLLENLKFSEFSLGFEDENNKNESIFLQNFKHSENIPWNSIDDNDGDDTVDPIIKEENFSFKNSSENFLIKKRRGVKLDNLRLPPVDEIFSKNFRNNNFNVDKISDDENSFVDDNVGGDNNDDNVEDEEGENQKDEIYSANRDRFDENIFDNHNDGVLIENDNEKNQYNGENLFEYLPKMNVKRYYGNQKQQQLQQNQQNFQTQQIKTPQIFNRRHVIDKLLYTREIVLKQGRIKGIVRVMHPQSGLKDVDQFLGIPYAEAPIGNRRFMPPGAPLPWNGIKIASHLPPVCPQNLPESSKTSSMKFSKGRLDQLIRLFAYLKNESEDCLYLNVYVPKRVLDEEDKVQKHPVIVYIHGESYEWNSGNPYDGSILASYGQVIVVTINYRLGILGFLKPGISEHTVSNFGLLDQIAALQWVKDNIESFGGDSNLVTLMGHGTGAACLNFLMMSPVAKGLFHRAILMSGSALSDWAMANHSLQFTMQTAHGLNCPIGYDEKFLNCLRKRRYQDVIKVLKSTLGFTTAFGPIVDGLVIPNQPQKVMEQNPDLFSRYDLLFGFAEVESYHMLDVNDLEQGIQENKRDNLLKAYLQHRFEIRPNIALAATLNRYTDIYNNPVKATNQEHRDVVLDILSDARVVGPLLQTGIFHAKVNPRSYMYVFGHNSEGGPYSHLPHSVAGEELAFVFGAPLAPAGPFPQKYSIQEKLLSEAVMQYWTNFAKTGNPKAPWRDYFINLHALEWDRYDIDWPEFNPKNQCYVNIGIPPSLGYRYREIYMKFWNKELPEELNQIPVDQSPPFIHFFPPSPANQIPRGGTSVTPNEVIAGRVNNYPAGNDQSRDSSLRTLKFLLQDPLEKAENMYNAQPTSKISKQSSNKADSKVLLSKADFNEDDDSEKTMHILIAVVVIVLVINTIIGIIYFIRKKKSNMSINRKLGILSYDGATDDDLKKSKHYDGDDSYILDIVKNVRKASKTSRLSPINGFKISRQISASTVDGNVKVTDWMSQDMVDFGSKSSKTSTPSFSFKRRSFLKRPKKVNVAIDATPQARSNSILRQEPIEITKLKSSGSPRNIIICQEVEVAEELLNPDDHDTNLVNHELLATISSLSSLPTKLKDSSLDPLCSASDKYCPANVNDEQITSFMSDDVNVTSRDDNCPEKDPLSPEEQLQTIKRRNFPKVLPDYYPTVEGEMLSPASKRKSLPPSSFIPKTPPMPPPRTISTLGRYPSSRRHSNSFRTSPLMLANYPEEEELKITENTLIVGPLLPKSQESIYCTIKPKKKNIDEIYGFKAEHHEPPNLKTETPLLTSFQCPSPLSHQKHRQQSQDTYKPLASVHRVYPIKDYGSRIPKLKMPVVLHENNCHNNSNVSSTCTTSCSGSSEDADGHNERDKTTSDSSSSDTNSSVVTVKTNLKQK